MHRGFHRLETQMDDVLQHLEQNQTGSASGMSLVTNKPTQPDNPHQSQIVRTHVHQHVICLFQKLPVPLSIKFTLKIDSEQLMFNISGVPDPPWKLCNSYIEKAYSSLNFVKFRNLIRQISEQDAYLQNPRMDLKPSNHIVTKVM